MLFVFLDGHGIAAFTQWFDDLKHLDKVDWNMVYEDYWADTLEDNDRQRRKQAEFLVYKSCPVSVITETGVISQTAMHQVKSILKRHHSDSIPVNVRRAWYY